MKRDFFALTIPWRGPLSYTNQYIDLLQKSMNWFLYDDGLRHESVRSKKNALLFKMKFTVAG